MLFPPDELIPCVCMKNEVKVYSLEDLKSTFETHSIKYKQDNKKFLEKYRKDYPDEKVPDHLNNQFCISDALYSIVNEVIELKKNED